MRGHRKSLSACYSQWTSLTLSIFLSLVAQVGCKARLGDPKDPLTYTNPRIGSGGGGFSQGQAFVGAAMPFAMVRPGPDTSGPLLSRIGFAHCAGYWAEDDTLDGFSQTHLHGTGVEDYGHLLLMPSDGFDKTQTRESGYAQPFDPVSEHASPGHYEVTLEPSGIQIEQSATELVALHRVHFPSTLSDPTLILDLGHGLGRDAGPLTLLERGKDPSHFSGWIDSAGRFTGDNRVFRVFFALQLNQPPSALTLWDDSGLLDEASPPMTATGKRVGVALHFNQTPHPLLEARIAISFVDAAGAEANLRSASANSFDELRAAALAAWKQRLQKVEVWGGSVAQTKSFYSALYHAQLMPTRISDVDGRYRALDRSIQHADEAHYSDFSLWDTYRTLHPLLALLYPEDDARFGRSLLDQADRIGYLPRWPLAVNATGTMIGAPASIVLSEAVQKNVPIDAARVMAALKRESNLKTPLPSHQEHARCVELGYCPADEIGGSVSKTIEFGWADAAVARLAAAQGETALATELSERARDFSALYDPTTGFLRGRLADGRVAEDPSSPFDPTVWTKDYTEGNAWQYLFAAPYDPGALVQTFGTREVLLGRLDQLFALSEAAPPEVLGVEPFFGPDLYYWHGNEPDLHLAYLYALLGAPGQGAAKIDWVRRRHYNDTVAGLPGNDDAGTLSAWYVFSALGLYPLAGTDLYLIGTPIFDRAVLHLVGGDLVVVSELAAQAKGGHAGDTPGQDEAATPEIESVTFNGEPLKNGWLHHGQLAHGGELHFIRRSGAPEWGSGQIYQGD